MTLLGTLSAVLVLAACSKSSDESSNTDSGVSTDDGTSAQSTASGTNADGSATSEGQDPSDPTDPSRDDSSSSGADDATSSDDDGSGAGGGGGSSDGVGGGSGDGATNGAGGNGNSDGSSDGAGGGQNVDEPGDDIGSGDDDTGAGGTNGDVSDDAVSDDAVSNDDDSDASVSDDAVVDDGDGTDSGAPDDTETSDGCAGRDYIICEDFEAASVGGIPDGWTAHGEPLQVTDAQAHHGNQALELGARINWERRIYHDASALGGNHYGRIYFKVQQPVPDAFVHSTLVALHGEGPTTGAGEFRVVDTVKQAVDTPDVASFHQYLYNVQPENGAEFGYGGPYTRPFDDQWHCVEYHIDDATQSYTLWVDGEEEISFENGAGNYEDSDMPSSYNEVRVGWTNYQDAPPGFVAWIDDVVFDDEPIGCEPLR